MTNLYNKTGSITDNQGVYDSFNNFMFSNDRNVFNKLFARLDIYRSTKHLHGDIVECGVYKGTGMLTWLKAMDIEEHHSIKTVVGFDMFDPEKTIEIINDETDSRMMSQVFSRDLKSKVQDDLSLTAINARLVSAGFDSSKFNLVKGDIKYTAPNFVSSHPGFRISILYLDLDIYEPTIAALKAFHEKVVEGGYIVFDEYAYQSWSESDAADEFIDLFGSQYECHKLNIKAPTMIMVKQ